MRFQAAIPRFDVSAKASLVWSRITFSRLTIIYLAFACLHYTVQVILQFHAFSINVAAANSLWSKMVTGNQTRESNGFAVLGDDLRICWDVPTSISVASCEVLWNSSNPSGPSYGVAAVSPTASRIPDTTSGVKGVVGTLSATPTALASVTLNKPSILPAPLVTAKPPAVLSPSTITIVVKPTPTGLRDDDVHEVKEHIGQIDGDHPQSFVTKRKDAPHLSDTCVKALIWPVQKLHNTKREDITFICFQFWVLGMSLVALLNESIPHIFAAFVTHILVTIWSIYQVFETEHFHNQFAEVITKGACKQNLLGSYWNTRRNAEIPSAVLNSVALLASAFLTYKLVKLYGWQTFKRVGASLTINRVYRLVLSLSIFIQIALFFIVAAMALWIDQLYNGNIGRLAVNSGVYKYTFIVVFCLLIPWLSLGWFAVRRENRKMALAFLILNILFISLWGAMFDSRTFRWTFVYWEFFTVMAITSGILMILTFILGLLCRFNFGKGLHRYLNAQQVLDDNFEPVYPEKADFGERDPEKVDFPSLGDPSVPTFAAAFARGPSGASTATSPEQPRLGMYWDPPREQQPPPEYPVSRSVSTASSFSATEESFATHKSSASTSSGRTEMMGKRWVIE